jgi:CHAD domain-containing protein
MAVMKKWNRRQNPAANARRVLPGLAAEYFREGDLLRDGKASNQKMHEFRLSTKAFRYTLELFIPVYGPGLKAKLESIKNVQQILGALQDCETVLAYKPRDPKLTAYAQARLETKRAQFLDYWSVHFASPAEQKKWAAYLSRHTREK